MKKYLKSYLFYFAVAGVLIFLDQLTKGLVRQNIQLGGSICPIGELCEQVRIVHWYNTGVAFGLFQGNSMFFAVLISLVIVAITVFYSQVPAYDWFLKLALAFEMGGAAGNLIDRVLIGHVTDFVAIGNFPVFNVADASINIGVAFMLISVILEEKKSRQMAAQETETNLEENSQTENTQDETKEKVVE